MEIKAKVHFEAKKIKEVLNQIIILVDTREKENDHILQSFSNRGIKYENRKLRVGDYSFYIPKGVIEGIDFDMDFSDEFVVERKNSLNELSSNLSQDRVRFENELILTVKSDCKMHLVVEDFSLENIYIEKYETDYHPNAFLGSLISFVHRYNLGLWFINTENSGKLIFDLIKYWIREKLK